MEYSSIFKFCIEELKDYEGGYSCNPSDAGGETYFGISRRNNKTWSGWKIIDGEKKKRKIKFGEFIQSLDNSVYDYYYNTCPAANWKSGLVKFDALEDQYNTVSRGICNVLFSSFVLFGSNRCIKILKLLCNNQNRIRIMQQGILDNTGLTKNPKPPMEINGTFTDALFSELSPKSNDSKQIKFLLSTYTTMLVGVCYNNAALKPEQMQFVSGWMNRFIKSYNTLLEVIHV